MPVVHAFKSNMVAQVSPCPAQNLACPAYMYTGAAQDPTNRAQIYTSVAQDSEPAALTVPTATLTAGAVAQDLQPAILAVPTATLTVGVVALIYRRYVLGAFSFRDCLVLSF